jgi:hypothetical protein
VGDADVVEGLHRGGQHAELGEAELLGRLAGVGDLDVAVLVVVEVEALVVGVLEVVVGVDLVRSRGVQDNALLVRGVSPAGGAGTDRTGRTPAGGGPRGRSGRSEPIATNQTWDTTGHP